MHAVKGSIQTGSATSERTVSQRTRNPGFRQLATCLDSYDATLQIVDTSVARRHTALVAAVSVDPSDAATLRHEIEHLRGAIASVRETLVEWDAQLRAVLTVDEGDEIELADKLLGSGGNEQRRVVAQAMAKFQHSSMRVRAVTIRTLVDQGGRTLTELAKRVQISRPMAARLYKAGGPEPEVPRSPLV